MRRALASALAPSAAAVRTSLLAVDGSATSVTCAGAVTTKLRHPARGARPRALDAPVLAYRPSRRSASTSAWHSSATCLSMSSSTASTRRPCACRSSRSIRMARRCWPTAPLGPDLSDLTYGADLAPINWLPSTVTEPPAAGLNWPCPRRDIEARQMGIKKMGLPEKQFGGERTNGSIWIHARW